MSGKINSSCFPKNKSSEIIINDSIVIYGTGTIAKKIYEVLKDKKYSIKYFLNKSNNYSNVVEKLLEVKVIDSKEIIDVDKKDITVIIAVFNREADVKRIKEELKKLGYDSIITYLDVFEIFKNNFEDNFYLNSSEKFMNDIDKILECKNLFKDDKSKELYNSIVKFRITKDYNDLIDKDNFEEQYFPYDVNYINKNNEIRFIDCGAFDGDTIRVLGDKYDNIDAIAAFEPDLTNYNNMVNDLNKSNILNNIKECIIIPCAVYSNSTQLKFNSGSLENSCIDDKNGSTVIQCVSVDESIRNFKPTHIKMDIEGSEFEGLLGAKKTIIKEKPNLAICLYHKPQDLYRIPLLINSWNIGYDFYLRVYGHSALELVLYAIYSK